MAEVQVRIGTLDQYLTPKAREAILVRLAALAIGRIKRRTGQGKDVEGAAFKPYSRRYAKQRRTSGRNDSPPTLLLSGAMLASMKVLQSSGEAAVIGFSGSSPAVRFQRRKAAAKTRTGTKVTHTFAEQNKQVANALKAAWNDRGEGKVPRRHFFGLSREDRTFLLREGIKQVIEAVRDSSLRRMSAAGALRKARLDSK